MPSSLSPAFSIRMSLVVAGVSKRYQSGVLALDDVSLEVRTGMFGLLGPNGAGKSTLMRVIATLLPPDAGQVRLGEIDALRNPAAMRAQLGYLPQEFGLYPNVPVQETLEHFVALKGFAERRERKEHAAALLERTNLLAQRALPVSTLSGGMRQRLGVAIALAGRPRLLVLDEPTAGLDPAERHRLYDLLSAIGDDVVVILSTHIVEDVRELCTSLALIDQGHVVLHGDPEAIVGELRGRLWRRELSRGDKARLSAKHHIISMRRLAGRPVAHIVSDAPPDERATSVEPTLEDAYFFRVGDRARTEG
jgi:ABC-2 type transport system ATP-binding protein